MASAFENPSPAAKSSWPISPLREKPVPSLRYDAALSIACCWLSVGGGGGGGGGGVGFGVGVGTGLAVGVVIGVTFGWTTRIGVLVGMGAGPGEPHPASKTMLPMAVPMSASRRSMVHW